MVSNASTARKARACSIIAAAILILPGCDKIPGRDVSAKKFEIKEIKGDVYLLDQVTGDVFLRDGQRLVALKKYDGAALSSLANAQSLFALNVKNLKFDIHTKYAGGNMYYKIKVKPETVFDSSNNKDTPANKHWSDYWKVDANFLVFNFDDKDLFQVFKQKFSLSGTYSEPATTLVDDSDNAIGYEYDGSIPMDPSDYQRIDSVEVTYSLDPLPSPTNPSSP